MTLLQVTTFVIFLCGNAVFAEPCNNPDVTRDQVYIYRITDEVKVGVFHCQFNYKKHSSLTYSDITKHCKISFGIGSLKDKWGEVINVDSEGSRLVVEEYGTKADLIRNEIKLRSGTVCRYDRGFCFDPKESVNYAVTWNVIRKAPPNCPKVAAEQVFYGYIDLWEFPEKRLKYLFYYNDYKDAAFYLKLTKSVNCNNKVIWYTERNGFIVTKWKLDAYSNSSSNFYFPIKPKRIITENILRNCDLHGYMQNLEKDHVVNPETADILVKLYEKLKMEAKTELEQSLSGDFRNLTIDIRADN